MYPALGSYFGVSSDVSSLVLNHNGKLDSVAILQCDRAVLWEHVDGVWIT